MSFCKYNFVLNSIVSLHVGLVGLPDLLQGIAHVPAHHLLDSADIRIPAPALGAAAVLALGHVLALPLIGLITWTLVTGEN